MMSKVHSPEHMDLHVLSSNANKRDHFVSNIRAKNKRKLENSGLKV